MRLSDLQGQFQIKAALCYRYPNMGEGQQTSSTSSNKLQMFKHGNRMIMSDLKGEIDMEGSVLDEGVAVKVTIYEYV